MLDPIAADRAEGEIDRFIEKRHLQANPEPQCVENLFAETTADT